MNMHSIAWWPTCAFLAVATLTDLRSRRIPNWLVVPFMVIGIVVSAWLHQWPGVAQSLGGIATGFGILGIFALMGGMGMGDVKLCAAIGAWVGSWQLVIALVVTGLAGGMMAICWAIYGGFLADLFKGSSELMFGWKQRGMRTHPDLVLSNPRARKLPYAPAIAIGTVVSFFAQ